MEYHVLYNAPTYHEPEDHVLDATRLVPRDHVVRGVKAAFAVVSHDRKLDLVL